MARLHVAEVAENLVRKGQWGPVSPAFAREKGWIIFFSKSEKSVLVVHNQRSQTSQATDLQKNIVSTPLHIIKINFQCQLKTL